MWTRIPACADILSVIPKASSQYDTVRVACRNVKSRYDGVRRPPYTARRRLSIGVLADILRLVADEQREGNAHEEDHQTGHCDRPAPTPFQHDGRHDGCHDPTAQRDAYGDDPEPQPPPSHEPCIDDCPGGVVEPGVDAERDHADVDQHEAQQVAGQRQEQEADACQSRPYQGHHSRPVLVDQVARDGGLHAAFECREAEDERSGGVAEAEVAGKRKEVDGEAPPIQPGCQEVHGRGYGSVSPPVKRTAIGRSGAAQQSVQHTGRIIADSGRLLRSEFSVLSRRPTQFGRGSKFMRTMKELSRHSREWGLFHMVLRLTVL